MIQKIRKILDSTKLKKSSFNFFELSSVEKKQIIEKAARGANKDQKDIVRRYKKKFGNS